MVEKKIGWRFDNTYLNLPEGMFSKLLPTPVKTPEIVVFNYKLSKSLGLDFSNVKKNELSMLFSGNKLPDGAETIAQAYAGHQFGHFTVLGDGRALTVGEHLDRNNFRYDIQFKGSGVTPYSRNADGRAALGPMLREYIISEALYNLGVPTSRSLAVTKTGENIVREEMLKGAILTRIASSHIRVGTFQYALISKEKKNLKALFDYTIKRHYPQIMKLKNPAVELLKVVMDKQIDLICNWMRIGFVHGVMNTDNMTISGETIDYGPCAFMDDYDPSTVFSSIDLNGRYAYFNQPRIAKWNLDRFAECLIPLIDNDTDKAIKIAENELKNFPQKYKDSWINMMKNKLGLIGESKNDEELIIELLTWMHQNKADYTNTFCYLMQSLKIESNVYNNEQFQIWEKKWKNRLKFEKDLPDDSFRKMKKANPIVIPRNFLVEKALREATQENNLAFMYKLLEIIENPELKSPNLSLFQNPQNSNGERYVTYCGT